MPRRKRDHIPLSHRLAAALACLLPQAQRDELRHRDPPAKPEEVIRLFTYDHLHLHSMGGSDHWSNLDPRIRGAELKAKDARDTSIAAKSKNIERDGPRWRAQTNKLGMNLKPPKPARSRFPSRPFRRSTR